MGAAGTKPGEGKPMTTTYTPEQLGAIFAKIHDAQDWKAPIEAWCRGEAVLPICEAIRFFTATEPKVELDTTRMRYLITSEGYRAGPAGDH
mgnify:FL=1